MRPILRCLAAAALTTATATCLSSTATAQLHVFNIDTPASSFAWSGTTSLGNLAGNPSNTFNLSGTVDMQLTGTQPTTAGEFIQANALITPDISANIPSGIPFVPPLATIDITNLSLSVSSPQFNVTAGSFTADVTLEALSGIVTTTPITGGSTITPLTGLVSIPTSATGTLTRVMDTITLNMPINSAFPISVMSGTTMVTGTIALAGVIVADATAIDLNLTDHCNGDGGDQMGCSDCPCMNNATAGTIGGCLNSAGTAARLLASGDASVSLPSGDTSDLRFAISGAPAGAFCILNSGDGLAPGSMTNPCFGLDSGGQALAFDGLRCAIMNTRRHGGRSADGNGDVGVTNSPWGGEGGPPVGLAIAGGGFVSGQTRYFQVINRDDATLSCMRGLNTSQAIRVTFTP